MGTPLVDGVEAGPPFEADDGGGLGVPPLVDLVGVRPPLVAVVEPSQSQEPRTRYYARFDLVVAVVVAPTPISPTAVVSAVVSERWLLVAVVPLLLPAAAVSCTLMVVVAC